MNESAANQTEILIERPQHASDQLLPLVYEELKKLAAAHLAQEQPGQTLQPTALVHEAYLRLTAGNQAGKWNSRGHFFAAAAIAIRRILIENARRKKAIKHGGELKRVPLPEEFCLEMPPFEEDILALDEALQKFAAVNAQAAEVVQLLYFGGLTHAEAAETLHISSRTVSRHWEYARCWLSREMDESRNSVRNC